MSQGRSRGCACRIGNIKFTPHRSFLIGAPAWAGEILAVDFGRGAFAHCNPIHSIWNVPEDRRILSLAWQGTIACLEIAPVGTGAIVNIELSPIVCVANAMRRVRKMLRSIKFGLDVGRDACADIIPVNTGRNIPKDRRIPARADSGALLRLKLAPARNANWIRYIELPPFVRVFNAT